MNTGRYVTGHCGAGGHARCRGAYAGTACACPCHQVRVLVRDVVDHAAVLSAGWAGYDQRTLLACVDELGARVHELRVALLISGAAVAS